MFDGTKNHQSRSRLNLDRLFFAAANPPSRAGHKTAELSGAGDTRHCAGQALRGSFPRRPLRACWLVAGSRIPLSTQRVGGNPLAQFSRQRTQRCSHQCQGAGRRRGRELPGGRRLHKNGAQRWWGCGGWRAKMSLGRDAQTKSPQSSQESVK